MYFECSAIIRNIDPEKDNYKSYCKSIIADIIRSLETDKIVVSIYDDQEAYELFEVKYKHQFTVLNTSEADTVARHTIVTYNGNIYSDFTDNYTLFFYSEAQNKYTEREAYQP